MFLDEFYSDLQPLGTSQFYGFRYRDLVGVLTTAPTQWRTTISSHMLDARTALFSLGITRCIFRVFWEETKKEIYGDIAKCNDSNLNTSTQNYGQERDTGLVILLMKTLTQ